MQTPKKILNDPKEVVSELIDGLVKAYHGKIRKLEDAGALVKTSLSKKKVGLLIGGGSGQGMSIPVSTPDVSELYHWQQGAGDRR